MMNMKLVKTGLSYALILAAGLGTGYVVANVPKWLKSPYTEGNYAAYYPNPQTKVVLYGTQTCPYCARAREFLHAKNIPYLERDVQHSDQAKKEFSQLGGTGVPVLLVGDRRIQGFNQDALDSALKKIGM